MRSRAARRPRGQALRPCPPYRPDALEKWCDQSMLRQRPGDPRFPNFSEEIEALNAAIQELR
ncbi:hypothetical protein [Chromobacterium sp.]|uniref:hypothetical protein n=1 Tax=Chromobacterium sp. TaxID=306190 RepID=UPI0035B415B6